MCTVCCAQGTGQITYAIPSGDGFVTDAGVINSFKTQVMKTSRYEITGGAAAAVQLQCESCQRKGMELQEQLKLFQ